MSEIINIKERIINGDYETYGMSVDTILELIGFENIHKDYVDDIQHHIDVAKREMDSLMEEYRVEFGLV